MPHVVVSDNNRYAMLPEAVTPVLQGWRVVFTSDAEACQAYVRERWLDPFLTSAKPASRKEPAQPLPKELPEGVVCPYPAKIPTARLIVFPHAGAGPSAYHALAKAFRDSEIEVLIVAYPGREIRYRTQPAHSMNELLAEFEQHVSPLLSLGPFAFYGHSMGALAAFEYARCLAASARHSPVFMVLTGRQAPSVMGHDMAVEHLSDAEFIEAVGRRYNAIPREVLDTPELLQLLLPALRADFGLVAAHIYRPANRLLLPAIFINGTKDPWISAQTLQPWEKDVQVAEQHWLPGDHFFLRDNLETIKAIVLKSFAKPTTLTC